MTTAPRRLFLKRMAAVAGAMTTMSFNVGASNVTRFTAVNIVVVGGGFAGATCTAQLAQLMPAAKVTLIEKSPTYTACPMSNLVLSGHRNITQQRFSYDALKAKGINLVIDEVMDVDYVAKRVTITHHRTIPFDVLVIAPGIAFDYNSIEGYSEQASFQLPHAWKAGVQTTRLREQLVDMPDGGLFVICAPQGPYRCPPGPYERASLVAHYFKQHKPKSKVMVLDRKDTFSKMPLFEHAWNSTLKGYVEWQGASMGAAVVGVDAESKQVFTDFDTVNANVINVIPEQRAGDIAYKTGLVDRSGWCPVVPATFASTLQPNTYVIGDAAVANAMPKSAFSANSQAKLCAVQIARNIAGLAPLSTKLINTCYSLITPKIGISVTDVFYPDTQLWQQVKGAGGTSPVMANIEDKRKEAEYAYSWFNSMTSEVFG